MFFEGYKIKHYYVIYKITNLINNKIYIGSHKCEDINDDYMGSGKHLKYAQTKYEIKNFKKEILDVYDNPKEMFDMESQLVNEEFLSRDDVYNIKIGGSGGFDYINENCNPKRGFTNEERNKASKILKNLHKNQSSKWNILKNNKIANSMKKYYENKNGTFKHKKHTDEAKIKISEANSKHQQGEKNSMYGKIWIYNLDEKVSKRIEKHELEEYIILGWIKGRKIKF